MAEKSFEQSLKSLEDIVNKMEHEALPLDKALTEFEKGIKLTKDCQKILETAEQKIEILTQHLDSSTQNE